MTASDRPLAGRRVVTTRDEPGRLDSLLAAAGADVVHVPLIEIVEADDGGAALSAAVASLSSAAWLVVTSKHGARRVAAAAASHVGLKLAAVGSRTADELSAVAGRQVDLVPERQTAADLLAVFPAPESTDDRVVLAQADRADSALADGLAGLGYRVTAVTAYSTRLRSPTPAERAVAVASDAVAFASGSAATSWVDTIGTSTPPVVVAIGPTTQAVAAKIGLQVSHVAADHTVEGLVAAVTAALQARP